jgi:hypothetical protein
VWDQLAAATLALVGSNRFKSLLAEVTGVLDHYPRLGDAELETLERSLGLR